MFSASIGDRNYQVEIGEDSCLIDGENFDFDLAKLDDRKYHLINSNKSYQVELVSIDRDKKLVEIKINNNVYAVALKDKMDFLLEKLGMDDMMEAKNEDLKAPMPGLILEISVENGQEISKGDKLMILEAMKMENVIKATGNGVVENIKVGIGDSVNSGQTLITFV